jgi:hypothetical protein
MGVGPQDVRQRHRVDVVALLPRHRGAFAIPGHGQRVDRVDRPTGRPQHRHQQPTRSLDRDRDRFLGAVARRGQDRGELPEAVQALLDPPLREELALAVNQRDVVMALGPVDAAVHRHVISPRK